MKARPKAREKMSLQINGGDHGSQEISIRLLRSSMKGDRVALIDENWRGSSKDCGMDMRQLSFFEKIATAIGGDSRSSLRRTPSSERHFIKFGLGQKCLFLPQSVGGKTRRMGITATSGRALGAS